MIKCCAFSIPAVSLFDSSVFFRFVFRYKAKDLNFNCMCGGTVWYKRENEHGHFNVSALSLKIAF
jgi:hypothetical protein